MGRWEEGRRREQHKRVEFSISRLYCPGLRSVGGKKLLFELSGSYIDGWLELT